MFKSIIGSFIRHTLTAGGGGLITAGVATQDEITSAIGAAMTLFGLIWSWYQKHKAKKETNKEIERRLNT